MYTVFQQNFNYTLPYRYNTIEQAIIAGIAARFCFSVLYNDNQPVYTWDPITGGKYLEGAA